MRVYHEAGVMVEMIPAPSNRTQAVEVRKEAYRELLPTGSETVEVGQEAYHEAGMKEEVIPAPSNRTRGRGGRTGGLP
jgi:hypothetical protein